jgi:ribosomal protein S18 acetylase RimI-like enzyme
MMKEVADLIRLGFPESTATKIASGELPMDTASRMQRAEEQGYDVDTPVYHGTAADVRQLKATGETTKARSAKHSVWLVDDPNVAGTYARYAAESRPVERLIEQADSHGRKGEFDRQEQLYHQAEELESSGELVDAGGQNILQVYANMKNPMRKDADGATMSDLDDSQLFKWLQEGRSNNNDGLIIDNFSDNADYGQYLPAKHLAVQPDQVRSVNAAFDPDYKGPNLLGEYALPAGSTALMASLLAAPEQAEAGPLAKVISKTINRQDDANLPWSSEAQYTHDQSGGFMRLGVYPDGRVSTLELEVPEEFRRRGIGGELQESALRDYPEMQGQVSSKSALRNAYRLGRRPVEEPNATLERALEMQSQASSVNMKRPTSGERGAATPGMMALLAAGGAGATAAGSESNAVTEATSRIVNHMLDNVTEVTDLLEIPQRGIQGLLRAGYGLMQGDGLDASLNAGADVVNQGVEATARQAGDAMLEKTGNPELATMAYTAVMLGSPI